MVREIKDKNLFQLAKQSAREIGFKTLSAYGLMAGLFVVIFVTFFLAQHQQDIRQRAAEITYINCDINPFTIDSEESQLLSLINSYRQSNGLRTLTLSSYLNRAAEWKALDMSAKNYVAHTDSLGRHSYELILNCGYPSPPDGENLALMNSGSSNAALSAWKKSPLHNDNLLSETNGVYDPQYNWSKIGIARVYNTSLKAYYWATEFGVIDDGTNGTYIASSAPTPTPTLTPCVNTCATSISPSSTCTYNSSGDSYCKSLPNGNVNAYCWNCTGGTTTTPTPTSSVISPTPTPTPTTIASSCPNTNSDGTLNQCRTSCLAGSTNLTGGNGACTSYLGQTAYCCSILNTSLCPSVNSNGTSNTCRSGSCLSGETNLSSGNAVCAKSLNISSGNVYCCTAPLSSSPTPTPTKAPTPTPTPVCQAYGSNYKTYCSGSYLYESYANGTCSTTINYLQTCSNGCQTLSTTTAQCVVPTPTPTPNLISCGVTTCNGSTQTCLVDTNTGVATCCAKGYSYVCSGTCSTVPCPTPTPSCPTCAAGSANQCVSSTQIKLCVSGCWKTYGCGGGYYCVTSGGTGNCVAPTPTPTPIVSSCPSLDYSTGYNNICYFSSYCPSGSSLYSSGTGNAACTQYYGVSPAACCAVTQPSGCPADGYNSCRQSGCYAGETNVSAGNAACAYAYGWHTGGYCCR